MKNITPLLVLIAVGLTLGRGATVSAQQAVRAEVKEQIQPLASADPKARTGVRGARAIIKHPDARARHEPAPCVNTGLANRPGKAFLLHQAI
jgi:hypothetical protein